jgi:hypothetical protein
MEEILHHAEEILCGHPFAAMELIELHARLRHRTPVATPTCIDLRQLLESHPARFRVVDPWARPWIHPADQPRDGTEDVVVVAVGRGAPASGRLPLELRLRESIRWVARGIDPRSRGSSARLYALLLAERDALERDAA